MNHKAIYALHPDVVTIDGNTAYDVSGNEVTINEAQVDAWVDPEAYKFARQEAYAPLAEQLDYIYHNGIEAWKTDMINPVKTKYPKEELNDN